MALKKSVVGAILIAGAIVFIHELAILKKSPNQQSSQSLNAMIIASPAFKEGGAIPQKFTCDGFDKLTTGGSTLPVPSAVEGLTAGGGDINPELHIQYVPRDAKSLTLIVDDPDAPGGTFTHWTVWNIAPTTTVIKEESTPPGGVEGMTSFGRVGYGGPCPPSGKPHRYFFKLYALDVVLDLSAKTPKEELEAKISSHILEKAELMGVYRR